MLQGTQSEPEALTTVEDINGLSIAVVWLMMAVNDLCTLKIDTVLQ